MFNQDNLDELMEAKKNSHESPFSEQRRDIWSESK